MWEIFSQANFLLWPKVLQGFSYANKMATKRNSKRIFFQATLMLSTLIVKFRQTLVEFVDGIGRLDQKSFKTNQNLKSTNQIENFPKK
jgi:hypothetical protein